MPQDTFEIKLKSERAISRNIDYFIPVLVYKTQHIKLGGANVKSKPFAYKFTTYETEISKNLKKADSSDETEFGKEINYLTQALYAFFSAGNFGTKYVKVFMYKDAVGAKDFPKYLRDNLHLFVGMINTYKKDDETGQDGLAIYKDDYASLRTNNHFFLFSTHLDNITNLFNNGAGNDKSKIIVVYSKGIDFVHLRFLSKYLYQASSFLAVNPYGIRLGGIARVNDTGLIQKLRDNKINFYALMNETGIDGNVGFKEGVTLEARKIDEMFAYDFIRYETMKELIRIWDMNDRQNSKLSALELDGRMPSPYTAGLECLFARYKENRIIVDYSELTIKIEPTPELHLLLSITITYNYSFDKVVLNIATNDIVDYVNMQRASGGKN